MDKGVLLDLLARRLVQDLEELQAVVAAAVEGATHEEAKPENEYDTRGLEQSYLAGAQAARLEALRSALASLEGFRAPSPGADGRVVVGSCVVVDDGNSERRYFLCPVGGGTRLEVAGHRWWVLSPGSPLGRRLVGRREGDVVEHAVNGEVLEMEVIEVL